MLAILWALNPIFWILWLIWATIGLPPVPLTLVQLLTPGAA
jgi:hypothetical protein